MHLLFVEFAEDGSERLDFIFEATLLLKFGYIRAGLSRHFAVKVLQDLCHCLTQLQVTPVVLLSITLV